MNPTEKERYDRQIRLWGRSTQLCLSHCHVHFSGLSGASPEMAKNLVLAGVHSVAVVDDAPITTEDTEQNYLFRSAPANVSRGSAAEGTLSRLNPFVRVNQPFLEKEASIQVAVLQVEPNVKHIYEQVAQLGDGYHLVNITIPVGDKAVGLFLYRKKPQSFEEQVRDLLERPDRLEAKSASFQSIILRCHLAAASTTTMANDTFGNRLSQCLEIVDRLSLCSVDSATVEQLCQAAAPRPTTAVGVTLVGASVAQHLVTQIGALENPMDSSSYTWMLFETDDTFEVEVGCE